MDTESSQLVEALSGVLLNVLSLLDEDEKAAFFREHPDAKDFIDQIKGDAEDAV